MEGGFLGFGDNLAQRHPMVDKRAVISQPNATIYRGKPVVGVSRSCSLITSTANSKSQTRRFLM